MTIRVLSSFCWITLLSWCIARGAPGEKLPVTGQEQASMEAFDEMMRAFMREHEVPGAAMAVARHGRIVYARGFGYADVEHRQPVEPDALFRIASVSKPFTGTAIVQLQQRGKLRLDDSAFDLLGYKPHLEAGAQVDPRLQRVTVRYLLHHTAGFDREASYDPMFRPLEIAKAMGAAPPPGPRTIVEYMMGQPLDFDPGAKEVYSNYGFCVLGRVIEKASGVPYDQYVRNEILTPLGIRRMRLGRSLEKDRADGEVHYYPRGAPKTKTVFDAADDRPEVPVAYGGWCIESMDAHGGWIASAPELVRFASALDDPDHCPILNRDSIAEMFARPKESGYDKDGKPKDRFYGCGWAVRPTEDGKANTWHNGLLDGSASLLVRRHDGLSWAVLLNTDYDAKGTYLGGVLDPLMHKAADSVKDWPAGWDFKDSMEP